MLASTTAVFAPLLAGASETVLYVVAAVLGLAIVLSGIGYGWRLIQRKITGRKV